MSRYGTDEFPTGCVQVSVRPHSPGLSSPSSQLCYSLDHLVVRQFLLPSASHALNSRSSCTFGLGTLSFIMAEAIPVFNYLLALNACVCFAPIALMLPGGFWLYDHGSYRQGTTRQKVIYWSHWVLPLFGAFFLVGGTYATIKSIIISNQATGPGK